MNVSINGPEHLTDEDARKIAEKWLKIRNRRTVTERALKALESANSENDDEMNADGWGNEFLLNEIETEKFVL